jgi:hypothetical protein
MTPPALVISEAGRSDRPLARDGGTTWLNFADARAGSLSIRTSMRAFGILHFCFLYRRKKGS